VFPRDVPWRVTGETRVPDAARALSMFDRGGEMGERMRACDWAQTPFGPAEAWPQSLRTAVGICLASRLPMCVRWGPELRLLYNDAYAPILGHKHPDALGKPSMEVWSELWDVIGPMLEGVRSRGEASWSEDQLLQMRRFGFAEETYFTWSYSPIRDESGGVGGAFTAVTETTSRVLSDRRLSALQRLAARVGDLQSIESACTAAAAALGESPRDVPFALLYLLDPRDGDAPRARLAAQTGGVPAALAPAELPLTGESPWPLAEVARASGAASAVRVQLPAALGAPGGPWPEPATTAVILPVARAGQAQPYGFLIAGASPRLVLDDAYLGFFGLVARTVADHIELARLRDELRTQHRALYELFSQAPVPIAVIGGPALVYEMANDLYFQVCGRSDIVGKPLLAALPELAGQGFEELLRSVLATGEQIVRRELMVRLDRRGDHRLEDTYWTFIYAPLRGTDGAIERVLVLCSDVTEQVLARRRIEQSEERFRRIVDQVQAGIVQTDLTGRITLANERFCEIVGRPAEELERLHIDDLSHPDDLQETLDMFHQLVADGAPSTLEKRYVRPDGSVVWVQNNVARIDDQEGRPQGAVAISIDITERRRAERALREREEQIHRLLVSEQAARHEAEALYRIAGDLAAARLDTDALVQRITDHATELVGAAFGAFFYNFTDAASESYLLYTLSGAPKEAFARFGLPRNTPLFARTFSGEGVVRIPDVKTDPRYGHMAPHHGMPPGHLPVTSYLAVPVVARSGEVLGGLLFGHPEPGRFTEQHERMVVAVAAAAAVAMDDARLYQESRRSEAQARESEERYRRIFETAAVSMWDTDLSALKARVLELRAAHGDQLGAFLGEHSEVTEEAAGLVRIRDVNPATLRLFEATGKADLASARAVFLPETRTLLRDLMLAIADGRRLFSSEAALQTATGRRLDVVVTMSLPPEDAVLDRVLATVIDISDRKAADAEREARLREAERALTFSETFVGILGHDLRNPLGAIISGSDLLLRRETNERVFVPVQRIRRSADRMTRMIEQILDLTRARLGGGIPIAPSDVDLAALADQLAQELEGAAAQQIVVEAAGDMRGHWDRDRLAQAISNLLGNAVEHGAAGEPVRLSLEGEVPAVVRIRVWNAGAIPEQILPDLFDPFRRGVPDGRARRSKGLGLGLYIVQQIVQGHGGTIEVRSTAGEGTTFTITIPRTTAAPGRGGPEAGTAR
jgi:PAS domain S-box-containing protein